MSHHQNSLIVFNADTIVGEAIVRELLDPSHRSHLGQQYHNVFATVRDISHSGDLMALGACLIEVGDSPDPNKLGQWMKMCKTCVLVPDCGSKNMVNQSKKLIDISKQSQLERCVLVSKLGVDETSVETAKWFHEVEHHFKNAGLPTTAIVRCAPLQQALFLFRPMLTEGKLHWVIKEDAKFTTISLRDIANFIVHELLHSEHLRQPRAEPHLFKLTGVQLNTPKDICQMLEKVVGEKIQYKQVERRELERYLRDNIGLHEILAKEVVDIQELINKGKLNFVSDDHKKSTGREPMKLSEWLNKHKALFHGSRDM